MDYRLHCNNELALSLNAPQLSGCLETKGVPTMDQFLKSLRERRSRIQARIEEEQARPAPDHLRLTALKKLKLRFREQIDFIERMNRHGRSAPIPVAGRSGSSCRKQSGLNRRTA